MKILGKIGLALVLISGVYTSADAQIYVRTRPARPTVVVTRPAQPGPNYVWVDEDWRGRGRNYEWQGGRWMARPSNNAEWVPGHWEHNRRGDYWVEGRWSGNDNGMHRGHYKAKYKRHRY